MNVSCNRLPVTLAYQPGETLPSPHSSWGPRDQGRPQETSVGEDDGTQKPFHRECFYVTGTRLSLITTSSPLVTVFDWEVVMGGESRSWSRGNREVGPKAETEAVVPDGRVIRHFLFGPSGTPQPSVSHLPGMPGQSPSSWWSPEVTDVA